MDHDLEIEQDRMRLKDMSHKETDQRITEILADHKR